MIKLATSIDSKSQKAMYQQLYESIVQQIRSGELPAGEKLPGKRTMAAELGISVNTVDTAYQMLTAEGFVDAIPRSGFRVCNYVELMPGKMETSHSRTKEKIQKKSDYRYDLSSSAVDTSLFPIRTWGKLQKELLYDHPNLLEPGDGYGEWELRTALADYLNAYRGVECTAGQIIIGAGVEYLLALLARLLTGKLAAVENPGYSRAKIILENNGKRCQPVSLDENGLRVDELNRCGASIVYVTPSHQFPTGITMPVGRRAELLRWAGNENDRYIIEDDYDSEYRFDIRPLPSLQGMSGEDGSVIYMSTVSRCLAPGIRIAYMVLPISLRKSFDRNYSAYSCTVSRLEQQTLAAFIRQGYFTRHLASMRNIYRARCRCLCDALQREFGNAVKLSGTHTGIHLIAELKLGKTENELLEAAENARIHLQGLSRYYGEPAENQRNTAVLIGYGGVCEEDIPKLVELLGEIWKGPEKTVVE